MRDVRPTWATVLIRKQRHKSVSVFMNLPSIPEYPVSVQYMMDRVRIIHAEGELKNQSLNEALTYYWCVTFCEIFSKYLKYRKILFLSDLREFRSRSVNLQLLIADLSRMVSFAAQQPKKKPVLQNWRTGKVMRDTLEHKYRKSRASRLYRPLIHEVTIAHSATIWNHYVIWFVLWRGC